jgi:hypothetical protein
LTGNLVVAKSVYSIFKFLLLLGGSITRVLDQRPNSRDSNMLGPSPCTNTSIKELRRGGGQRKEVYLTLQLSGRRRVSISACLQGTDRSFRFK